MRACITVGFTRTLGDGGRIKPSNIYTFTWLPNGYAVTLDDRMVCALFDPDGKIESGLYEGKRHPLIDAIASAVESHLRNNPNDVVGFLENR